MTRRLSGEAFPGLLIPHGLNDHGRLENSAGHHSTLLVRIRPVNPSSLIKS
jgi:hypothetical protein